MPYHQIKTYIDDYIDGKLPPDEKERFEKLLESDTESRRMYEHEKMIRTLLKKSTIPDPGDKYWKNLEDRILDRTITRSAENTGNSYNERIPRESGIIHYKHCGNNPAPLRRLILLLQKGV